jgi:hypothetical protein
MEKQRYAHLHRLLEAFMKYLETNAGVTWLGTPGHVYGDYNLYHKAIYTIDLNTIQNAYKELTQLQTEIVQATGRLSNLLQLPTARHSVVSLTLSATTQSSSNTKDKETLLRHLVTYIREQRSEYDDVARYEGPTSYLHALSQTIARAEQLQYRVEQGPPHYRTRAKSTSTKVHVTYQDGKAELLYVNHLGLIIPSEAQILPAVKRRKERADKINVEPFGSYGPITVYDQDSYETAKHALIKQLKGTYVPTAKRNKPTKKPLVKKSHLLTNS